MEKRIAVVTGANRGIGFEASRQLAAQGLHVIMTSRDENKGRAAEAKLKSQGLDVEFHRLDVTKDESVAELRKWVTQTHGKLDVLVNNAGVLIDQGWSKGGDPSALAGSISTIRETMETNVYGPFRMIQAFAPVMKERGYGRIVNISSGMGQLTEMEGGFPAYRISKTALNAVTRIFSNELADTGILINSMCPGWVKTDMGGVGAERTPEQGADTVIWLATLPEGGPNGGFFRDREPIEW